MPRCWLFRIIALGGNALDMRRGQLLHVHQERTVSVDVNHVAVRPGNLGPNAAGNPNPIEPRPALVSNWRGCLQG